MASEVFIKPRGVRGSPTMGAGQLAERAKAMGVDVITFTLGDLFPKPHEENDIGQWVQQLKAAHAESPADSKFALRKGDARRGYAPAAGLMSLRDCAAFHFTRDTGMEASGADVRIGHGGKGTLTGSFRNFEKLEAPVVLMAAPGWPTNYDVFPAGTHIVEVDTQGRGLMDPEQLSAALAQHENPAIILINAPSNPTGENYDAAEREALLKVVAEKTTTTTVVFDDPYGKLVFRDAPYVITQVLQRGPLEKQLFAAGRVAVIRTASKEYGMADSRVGWLVTKNKALLESLQNFNESEAGGISGIAQEEVMAALHYGDGFIERTVAELKEKRRMVIDGVGALAHAKLNAPQGTIYAWIDFSPLQGKTVPASAFTEKARAEILSEGERAAGRMMITTPDDMMRYLAYVVGICPVQGTPFYAPGLGLAGQDWHIRFTFCGNKDDLARGIAKLQAAEKLLA
jgi:aspartate/methionine/tyrosine aminotransferase